MLNPAASLMIPLCECTHSCFIFPIAAKYVAVFTFYLAFVHMLFSLAGCKTFLCGGGGGGEANGSSGFREKTL